MSNTWPYEDAINATRESIDAYFEAAKQNPPIETTHSVNLGSIASRLNIALDVHDLTAAVEHVNEQHNVMPPIKVLGKIASEDRHNETYYTSAKGLHKTFVWVQLRSIVLGKLQAKNSGNL